MSSEQQAMRHGVIAIVAWLSLWITCRYIGENINSVSPAQAESVAFNMTIDYATRNQ